MNVSTKTYIISLFCVLSTLFTSAENVAIIESKSYHHTHRMDDNWQNIIQRMGHTATIFDKDILDDAQSICEYDLIIIAHGLTQLDFTQKDNLIQYARAGVSVYVQAEYQVDNSGNELFHDLVTTFGGNFSWEGESLGDLGPMQVVADMSSTPNITSNINYFWYGAYGNGDETIIPFLKNQNKNYGFIFEPKERSIGKLMTITDQDWIREFVNPAMMENILTYFFQNPALTNMPDILIQANEEMPCAGSIVTFNAMLSHSLPALSYQWMINGQDIIGATGRVYTTGNLQEGDVIECRIDRNLSCDTRTAVSNPILISMLYPLELSEVIIDADKQAICQNEEITFLLQPSTLTNAKNIRMQWKINGMDINGAIDSTFIANTLQNGDEITCMVTYDDDCKVDQQILSENIIVAVSQPANPIAQIIADRNSICQGEEVTFSINGLHLGSQPSYQWLINNVNTGVTTATFTSNSLYNGEAVSCIVNSSENCITDPTVNTESLIIDVMTPLTPEAVITADQTEICLGETVTFTVNGQHLGAQPSYEWMVNGQPAGADTPEFSTITLEAGHIISCRILSNEFCVAFPEVTPIANPIIISQPLTPEVTVVANNSVICFGETATFTANGNHLGTQPVYRWLVDGQEVSGDGAVFSTSTLTAGQEVSCIVSSDLECLTTDIVQSVPVSIQVKQLEITVLELAEEHCAGQNGLIEIDVVGGEAPYSYAWNNGEQHNLLTNLSSDKYAVVVSDAQGCTAQLEIEVPLISAPAIQEVVATPSNCRNRQGSAQVIPADLTASYEYRWTNEEGQLVGLSAAVANLSSGTYTVEVEDTYGCIATEIVEVAGSGQPQIEDLEVPYLKMGDAMVLNPEINSTQTLTYEWFPAKGLSCTDCANPVANPIETTAYTLTVTNENGCQSSIKVVVKVLPHKEVYIPNAFSPNADGSNDYFTVFGGNNVSQIKHLKVVDRWGNVIFSKSNFDINAENQGWDGTFKGQKLSGGVYIYLAEVQYINGDSHVYQGDINLMP